MRPKANAVKSIIRSGVHALNLRVAEQKLCRDGVDRIVDPEVTFSRVQPVAKRCGVSRLGSLTGLDCIGLPVWSATRPLSRSVAVSMGKGMTDRAAQVSALMEAVENFHAETIAGPLLFESADVMRKRFDLIAWQGLSRLKDRILDPSQRLYWIEGWRMSDRRSVWVPYDVVHTDYTFALPASGFFFMSSNGLASGNTVSEAIIHGLCELIERDAITLSKFRNSYENSLARIDPGTIRDPSCMALLKILVDAGTKFLLDDMTSDVGVAAIRCCLWDGEESMLHRKTPIVGFGCHPRREIAMIRAITEAAQGRAILVSGARDDLSYWLYNPERAERLSEASEVALNAKGKWSSFEQIPTRNNPTTTQDLRWLQMRLGAAGLKDIVVIDLTRDDFAVPVVRVVVPGLEAMSEAPGYTPGLRASKIARRSIGR